ncbi:0916bda7-9be9-4f3b-8120-8820965858de [Thermothielavioides terrestris]|uniref:0916bda7-9be9-4f3b-8120-8820965858de n=1 Tax=Thermothielavioides terrestris TaxID=2587410 RepID=A0A3S4B8G4_9PEZI|nr:0916bda7-9be9-4f3b-8120-8820965858de [Thermothielavioides terrestris]
MSHSPRTRRLIASDPIKRGTRSGCRGWDPRHAARSEQHPNGVLFWGACVEKRRVVRLGG